MDLAMKKLLNTTCKKICGNLLRLIETRWQRVSNTQGDYLSRCIIGILKTVRFEIFVLFRKWYVYQYFLSKLKDLFLFNKKKKESQNEFLAKLRKLRKLTYFFQLTRKTNYCGIFTKSFRRGEINFQLNHKS